jgi:hypothetical protein
MVISARLLQCAEMAQTAFGLELSGPFEPALAAQARRLDGPTSNWPTPIGNLLVVHPLGLAGKIVFLLLERLASLAPRAFERRDLCEHLLLLPVAQPM